MRDLALPSPDAPPQAILEAALALGHVTAEQFDAWVVPGEMVGR